MAIYIGSSEKLLVNFGNVIGNLFVGSPMQLSSYLLSADKFILQDINGLYLIPKEEEDGI